MAPSSRIRYMSAMLMVGATYHDNLIRPSWYVAPTISIADMYRILLEGAIDHPNWTPAAEGILNPGIVSFVERSYRFFGGTGPLWAKLPQMFRFMNKMG